MEEGRPVAWKRQTDSSSLSVPLKWTHFGFGGGGVLAGGAVRGEVGSETSLRREHLRDDLSGLWVGEVTRGVSVIVRH